MKSNIPIEGNLSEDESALFIHLILVSNLASKELKDLIKRDQGFYYFDSSKEYILSIYNARYERMIEKKINTTLKQDLYNLVTKLMAIHFDRIRLTFVRTDDNHTYYIFTDYIYSELIGILKLMTFPSDRIAIPTD